MCVTAVSSCFPVSSFEVSHFLTEPTETIICFSTFIFHIIPVLNYMDNKEERKWSGLVAVSLALSVFKRKSWSHD